MVLSGKVALVTGGARRVGKALSLALARSGADVVVNYNDSEEEAASTVDAIRSFRRRAIAVHGDVSNLDDIRQMMDAVSREFGRLDILVNNAATFIKRPFLDIDESEWDHVMGVNLKGAFFLTQAAAPLLKKNGDGLVVNIADLSAFQAWPSYAHHAVSKAGLVHFTRVAARALAPDVRVNCIAPGTVLPPADYNGEGGDGTSDRRVLNQEGTPGDVARALLYLVDSNFVTGAVVILDGGRLLL